MQGGPYFIQLLCPAITLAWGAKVALILVFYHFEASFKNGGDKTCMKIQPERV